MSDRLLRLPEVCRKISMSRSWVYTQLANDAFPAPIRIGVRAIAWRESDVDQWIAEASRSVGDAWDHRFAASEDVLEALADEALLTSRSAPRSERSS